MVSVIVPAYNREATLHKTVKSVYRNDYRPVQLVIVDDGSEDNTLKISRELKSKLETVNFSVDVITQVNKGASSARNAGIQRARGSYLMFLDSDDEITPDKLSTQVAILNSSTADVCVSDFEIWYEGRPDNETNYVNNTNPLSKVIKNGSIGCSTALIRSELAKSVSWSESLPNYQDMDYFLKVLILAKDIVHLKKSTYLYYRFKEGTISADTKKSKVPFFKRCRSLLFDCILNFKYALNLRGRVVGVAALAYLIASWTVYTLRSMPYNRRG